MSFLVPQMNVLVDCVNRAVTPFLEEKEGFIESLKKYDLDEELRFKISLDNRELMDNIKAFRDQARSVGVGKGEKCFSMSVEYEHKLLKWKSTLAQHPYSAVRTAEKANALDKFMFHDPLTLLKSKIFMGFTFEMASHSVAKGYDCVVCVADLDNFKIINDGWSHDEGDFAIMLACQKIGSAVNMWNQEQEIENRYTVALRFGGDEFVFFIIWKSEDAHGLAKAKKLLNDIHNDVTWELQKHFPFSELEKRPTDRENRVIEDKGSSISIAVSKVLQCGQDEAKLIFYQDGYRSADDLLNKYKPLWKDPEKNAPGKKPNGGGIIFLEDITGDRKEVYDHLNTLLNPVSLPSDKKSALENLCELSKDEDSHVRTMNNDMLKGVINFLRSSNATFQGKAASLIMNISEEKENSSRIRDCGGLKPLKDMLWSDDEYVLVSATGALYKLAAEDVNKVKIVEMGGLQPLIRLLTKSYSVAANAARVICNLATNKENQKRISLEDGLEALLELLTCGNYDAEENAAWALKNLTVDRENMIKVIEIGGLKPIFEIATKGSKVGQEYAVGVLRNLSSKTNNVNRVKIVRDGQIRAVFELLKSCTPFTKAQVVALVRNLTANEQHMALIVQHIGLLRIIEELVELSISGTPDAQLHSAAVIWNLSRNAENRSVIVEQGRCLQQLKNLESNGNHEVREMAKEALAALRKKIVSKTEDLSSLLF